MTEPVTFRTTIAEARTNATGIVVPPEAVESLASGKKPAVVVTVEGYTYRSTVASMGGRFLIPVSAEHRAGSGVVGGQDVEVTLALDTEPRVVEVPADLREALDADDAARASYALTAEVHPVLALSGPADITTTTPLREVRVLQDTELSGLARTGGVLKPADVEALHAMARDRHTWGRV